MTSTWVIAAMIRSDPCGQNRQVAISMANTRLNSRAPRGRGALLLASSSQGLSPMRKPYRFLKGCSPRKVGFIPHWWKGNCDVTPYTAPPRRL